MTKAFLTSIPDNSDMDCFKEVLINSKKADLITCFSCKLYS